MYKVIWKSVTGDTLEKEFHNLDQAMNWAKEIGLFVTIQGNSMEIVGVFGADSIKDGKCPDGVDYTWMKRRSQ